jgi:hypothetical protein
VNVVDLRGIDFGRLTALDLFRPLFGTDDGRLLVLDQEQLEPFLPLLSPIRAKAVGPVNVPAPPPEWVEADEEWPPSFETVHRQEVTVPPLWEGAVPHVIVVGFGPRSKRWVVWRL